MESWVVTVITLCISFFIKFLFNYLTNSTKKLPPGPHTFPVIGSLLWARKSPANLEPILRDLKVKYGPMMITLNIRSGPSIFVASHSLAYQALVQQGAVTSNRPANEIINSNYCQIHTETYGTKWRHLRRNLTSEILHPSRIKSYSNARSWVLGILIQQLRGAQDDSVKLVDHFQYAMFCLLVLMCFGDKLDESQIKQIENVQRALLVDLQWFNILKIFPRVGKIIFRSLWKELHDLRREQENIFIPLIEARRRAKEQKTEHGEELIMAYVDTLLSLELPDEKRNLNHGEIISLCGEFLNGGTDTTSTALEWVMANLVKNPSIQEKLYQEIAGIVGEKQIKLREEAVKEEDLQKMSYLKAVILEGLRRHPPGHFVLPHTVTEDVELNGHIVPKDATINFMVADMALDPNVWEDPLEFKPDRFLVEGSNKEGFDITGSREIKMMPFGAGRRICPGYALAMLHLEYFVANLIWHFQWNPVEGDDVDLSEKLEFTVMMKNSLGACICPRIKSV
ncbi:Cytochrome 89A2 [Capsicum baccatum]|uniref:Cytochrome 89A2 n=1 Tax=Capsicum baccatum TaxID=33114 RepID=A0A2G2X7I8_CAPBA|nr:Cytochrome 89A2 [Capsicum baccatum]